MYTFKRRASISLVVVITILLSIIITTALKSIDQESITQTKDFNSNTVDSVILVGNLLIGFILSVFFLSFESITQILIRRGVNFSKIIERCRARSFNQNISILEKYDTLNSYKITNSVIFQMIIITIALYASFTNSALAGQVLVLSVAVQLFAEQFIKITRGDDIQEWFWQIGTNVKIDVQRMYFLGISIMTFMAFYFMLSM